MPRKRITLSLNTDAPADKVIFDFLIGLPRRTRSEIIKEILFDALEEKDLSSRRDSPPTKNKSDPEEIDPDAIIEKLF